MSDNASAISVNRSRLNRRRVLLVLILIAGMAAIVAIGAWRFRHRIRPAYNVGRTLLASISLPDTGGFTNVLFLHHSTGRNLIEQGNVRALFTEAGFDFWDHDYNDIGLTRPDGTRTGYSYNIVNDNTDPDGLADLFAQPVRGWPINAFSSLMQHEVIIFKSCFPVSDISSQAELDQYKRYYLGIRDVIDRHPDRIFVALTPPPLVPESTTPENATRAREFADWLKSDEYLDGHANLVTFDFSELLAEDDPSAPDYGMLRTEYRPGIEGDSHPNALANETTGPLLVEFVVNAVQSYRASRQ